MTDQMVTDDKNNDLSPLNLTSPVASFEQHVAKSPDATPFVFLGGSTAEPQVETYESISEGARRVATQLLAESPRPAAALLVCDPGPNFVIGLLACFYAGVPAVPCYPPSPTSTGHGWERFQAVAADSGACVAICDGPLLAGIASNAHGLRWIAVDGTAGPAEAMQPVDPESVAFIQYTSGSTGRPKGVMVSHENIMANLRLINEGVEQGPGATSVLWLPPYHDMGLLNTLYALVNGYRCVSMSPLSFVKRPTRWLDAISDYGATYSGAPTFAFELAARRTSDEAIARLDLRRWEVAFCGAEPIDARVLNAFADRFAPCGFRREALYPCYGLAEFTVAISGGSKLSGIRAATAEEDESGRTGHPVVSCGTTKSGHAVAIVDPETQRLLPEGHVGEIWATGPSRALGYWGDAAATSETFEAHLDGGSKSYLRTGDLGFVKDGHIHVTGRIKELIIVHGRNFHPHDIEAAAADAHPAVRRGGVAAFGITERESTRLVVLAEVRLRSAIPAEEVVTAIRKNVRDTEGLNPAHIVLVSPRSLPLTTSGKLKRLEARERWLSGELSPVTASAGADASA